MESALRLCQFETKIKRVYLFTNGQMVAVVTTVNYNVLVKSKSHFYYLHIVFSIGNEAEQKLPP